MRTFPSHFFPYLVQVLEPYDRVREQDLALTPESSFVNSGFSPWRSNADSEMCVEGGWMGCRGGGIWDGASDGSFLSLFTYQVCFTP